MRAEDHHPLGKNMNWIDKFESGKWETGKHLPCQSKYGDELMLVHVISVSILSD